MKGDQGLMKAAQATESPPAMLRMDGWTDGLVCGWGWVTSSRDRGVRLTVHGARVMGVLGRHGGDGVRSRGQVSPWWEGACRTERQL